jgi:hypothetical protein
VLAFEQIALQLLLALVAPFVVQSPVLSALGVFHLTLPTRLVWLPAPLAASAESVYPWFFSCLIVEIAAPRTAPVLLPSKALLSTPWDKKGCCYTYS